MTAGDTIDVADLPTWPGRWRRLAAAEGLDAEAARGGTLREFKDNSERAYLANCRSSARTAGTSPRRPR